MKSKVGKIFLTQYGDSFYYIIGKVIVDCKSNYKYKLIKSNYPHSPYVNYYMISKNLWSGPTVIHDREFNWYDSEDELMVEML
jgi:hypothetical protein